MGLADLRIRKQISASVLMAWAAAHASAPPITGFIQSAPGASRAPRWSLVKVKSTPADAGPGDELLSRRPCKAAIGDRCKSSGWE